MKHILILAFLLFAGQSYAGDFEGLKSLSFVHVISDVVDKSVPKGKCLITGIVYYEEQMDPYSYVSRPCDSLVSAFYKVGEGEQLKVKKNGSFSVTVDTVQKYMSFMAAGSQAELFETIYLEHYPFKSGHRIELAVYLPLKARQMMIEVDKPVIYAYSDKALDVNFMLKVNGKLTFTYPQIPENGWEVTTQQNGMLKDKKGNLYPYLFWEGEMNKLDFKINAKSLKGNFVFKDSVVPFLERSLTELGFNDREKADFITFWAPRMIRHEQLFVQFLVDQDCDRIAMLDVTPEPDHIRRVYLLFQEVQNGKTFEYDPQAFRPFVRSGFTVLEWGGSELKNDEL
ncbi:MAG: hypothetical protein K0R65_2730 [Crocinitomicaceae bacterium]|jgi:hypothetical protein|nr:hypothetical protein [Crocinitomicaceae bacterium]